MRAIRVDVDGWPREIGLPEGDSLLGAMQEIVGGYVEPVHLPLGGGVTVTAWVDEEGLGDGSLPNRAIYATKDMVEDGWVSQMDMRTPLDEGGLYAVTFGDMVVTGFDHERFECRDLAIDPRDPGRDEYGAVMSYFTCTSAPASGMLEVAALRGLAPETLPEDAACGLAAMRAMGFLSPDAEAGSASEWMDRVLAGTSLSMSRDLARWTGELSRAMDRGALEVWRDAEGPGGEVLHTRYDGPIGGQPTLMGLFDRFERENPGFVRAVEERLGRTIGTSAERIALLHEVVGRLPECSYADEYRRSWDFSGMRLVSEGPSAYAVLEAAERAGKGAGGFASHPVPDAARGARRGDSQGRRQ